jgi:hypothetical protein
MEKYFTKPKVFSVPLLLFISILLISTGYNTSTEKLSDYDMIERKNGEWKIYI